MWYGILGTLEVLDGEGRVVDVGGAQPRLLLALLLAAAGQVVPADAAIDAVWGESPPPSANGTLQSYVSRLRRRLGEATLRWEAPGYRLDVDPATVDAWRFEAAARRGRAQLDAGHHADASETLSAAAALWRGPALLEFRDLDFARGLATRLEELRLVATEDRLEADLALGRHDVVAAEIPELVAQHPLREELRRLHALALYRSGRQADALRVLDDARRTLRDELGVEPGRALRELEQAILVHDPAIDRAPASGAGAGERGAVVTAAPVADRAASVFGRDPELHELLAAAREARTDSRFVVVEGEPGIGKTRLAEELRLHAVAAGAFTAWGRTDEGGAAPALWPWLRPLHLLAARAGETTDALASLLAGTGDETAGEPPRGPRAFEQFEAVAGLIDRVASTTPVVLLLDDLQWADATSCELLAFLAGRLGPGVLVVVTVRRLEVGRHDAVTDALAAIARRPGSRRLQLRGLDATSTRAVIESTITDVAPDVATAIHERAEGNPFYAVELARLLADGGPITDVPSSVGDVIRRRLGRLPRATTELLGVAAVIGRDVELGLLTRTAELPGDDAIDRLEPALVHRLLVEVPDEPAVFRFSHALVREVVLDDLSALRRARLHQRVADAIEAGGAGVDDAEIVAEHRWRATPVGGGAKAADALERAAEVAVHRVSYASAEQLLTRAVQLRRSHGGRVDELEAELRTMCRLMEVARMRRYYTAAVDLDLLDRAKELAAQLDQGELLLDLLWVEWSAAATTCRVDDAGRLVAAIVEVSERTPSPGVEGRACAVQAVHCWQTGDMARAVELRRRAGELLDASRRAGFDLNAEFHLLSDLFDEVIMTAAGERTPDEAIERLEAIADAQEDPFARASGLGFAATVAMIFGRFDALAVLLERERAADPGAEYTYWHTQATARSAVLAAWRGEPVEAMRLARTGRAEHTAVGGRASLATIDAYVSMGLTRAGLHDDAAAFAASAREELDTFGERWTEPFVLLAEAVLRGDDARDALAAARAQGSFGVAATIAELASQLDASPAEATDPTR